MCTFQLPRRNFFERGFFEPHRQNIGILVSLFFILSYMGPQVVGTVGCRAAAEEFTHRRENPLQRVDGKTLNNFRPDF